MIRKLYNYYLSPEKNFARSLTAVLGFIPAHLYLYRRAFTHRSPQEDNADATSAARLKVVNNERLEFLGDAILDAVTAEYLFNKYPTQDEGFLTQMRSKMVNRKILNRVAEQMGLDTYLREHGAHHISPTMLGNTFEAFVGAIYLDAGFDMAKQFIIKRMLQKYIDVHELETLNDNFKSLLLEHCQKQHKPLSYELLQQYRGKNNRDRFKVAVLINNEQIATAEDFNKKSAEQVAARNALIRLGLLTEAEAAALSGE